MFPTDGQSKAVATVSGEFEVGSQYHFHMETQRCLVRPREEGEYDVLSAKQWIGQTQLVVAKALGIPMNKINMRVRRIGGAYGAKVTRPQMVASACAVAAAKLRRPVRLVLDLQTNMEMVGSVRLITSPTT